jgi:hypothetical protein
MLNVWLSFYRVKVTENTALTANKFNLGRRVPARRGEKPGSPGSAEKSQRPVNRFYPEALPFSRQFTRRFALH